MSALSSALIGGHQLASLLDRWGYGVVLVVVALQSLGAPLPGTTALIAAALYAGSTHHLNIAVVILAAVGGAMLGGVAAFTAGRHGGARLLARHGGRVRLTPARLTAGEELFRRHGGRIVLLGRFITGLRNTVAFLAGSARMPARSFVTYSAAAALLWSLWNGLGYYYFGRAISRAGTVVTVIFVALLGLSLVASARLLRRGASQLLAAEASERSSSASRLS